MIPIRAWGRLLAALAAIFVLAVAAGAQEKLDPRLRGLLLRPPSAGGFTPQGAYIDAPSPSVRLFVRLSPGADADALRARFPTGRFEGPVGTILTGELPLADLERLGQDPAVAGAEGARQLKLSMEIVRSSVTSGGIWLGALDAVSIDFGTTLGSGVVVGLIDSGIDFTHPDFYTEGAPNRTRILSIWDQTISSHTGGPFPSGFAYGAEYSRTQIDDEIDGSPAGVVLQRDTVGHGSHVAGIAAGDGSATDGDLPAGTFKGIAPEADIVMVKSDLTDTHILNALTFIVNKAAAAGKRAVVNMSLGTQYGPHDGTSALDTGVAAVALTTPVVVAMGNEQDGSVHASTTIATSGTALFTLAADAGVADLLADFWVPSGDTYTVEVSSSATATPQSCSAGSDCLGLTIAGNTIDIFNTASGHPSGDRESVVDIYKTGGLAGLNWRVKLLRATNGGSGRIDGWVATNSSSFTALVDSSGTLSSPATANNVVAVASYCSKRQWRRNDGTFPITDTSCSAGSLGDISVFSNRGPTRDGRQKPDLTAPGQRIASTLSVDQGLASGDNTVAFDGKHKLINGTSMATPVVTGTLARSLQQTPSATAASLRSTLQTQARSDAKVAGWGALPNPVFGYGKLRILGCGEQLLVAPSTAAPSVLGTSSISWTWAALSGATSYKVYYATAPASLIVSTGLPAYTLADLSANTTIALRVTGVNVCGEGPGQDSASTSTLAVPLATFSRTMHVSSATLAWTSLPAAPRALSAFGYRAEASVAADFSGPIFSSVSPAVGAAGLAVAGLTAFTSYYFRVATLNDVGAPHFIAGTVGFTNTTLLPPGAGPFSAIAESSISASWTLNGNPTGLEYLLRGSTAADFSGTLFSSQTFALSAVLSGLALDTTYHFQVRPTTGPFAALGSTATLGGIPGAATVPFTAVFQTSMSVAWTSGSNPASTRYRAELAASSDFLLSPQSSATAATGAIFTGLDKNTTYYLRVASLNKNSVPSSFGAVAGTATLTNVPAAVVPVFGFVGPSSASVNWAALSLVPLSETCEGYIVTAATTANFSGSNTEARTPSPGATGLTVTGLLQNSTYYFRVGALNWHNVPSFIALGSTLTSGALLSSATYDGGSLLVTINPAIPQLSEVQVSVPPGTFDPGTQVIINATIIGSLPPPSSSQGIIALLGNLAGVDISAGTSQPRMGKRVSLRFTYVPASLPAGVDARRLVVGRYTGSGWTLLPTTLDASAATLTAETDHFTLFAPLIVTAPATLDAVQAFPIPWKPGSNNPSFDAQGISFTGIPEGGQVRIFTILGEEVADLSAGPSGILLWDGKNTNGRRVGSGTYVVLVSGGGARQVLRVAVVR